MTRSERLFKEGKTDTMHYGTICVHELKSILNLPNSVYIETDYAYNVDVYQVGPEHFVAARI